MTAQLSPEPVTEQPERPAGGMFGGHPRALLPIWGVAMWDFVSFWGMQAILMMYMIMGLGIAKPTAMGVMGAYMQPQGHVQVLMNMLHFGMNPQEALDAPRWQWTGDKYIEIEPGFGESIAQALIAKGHDVNIQPDFISFGRGQIIVRDENGVLMGATEPRADGCVASW